jgi:hypothetical protein
MSVRKRDKQFEVRWTEAGRKLSRIFLRAEDARAFDVDIKRRVGDCELRTITPMVVEDLRAQ